ncbi:L-seryl-tRNA(Sec) selenium transferase [Helicobacter turcicus]|uniref:L-seryl-tRNA(Sec) selenium transferase n=1 Tax=Helicobacter turcicus TaxID=2867412 RepID=A0ABS7JM55_9HELI|nr:L-seryl-tRNA(Sec) selenium transferase [Helicobacter turcicus]MBX7490477.1 L-seryl-tRNA(Sec) selenium transferase [Helicobacter turcicus]MBX7545337.1 L-seryl-tRNA(Sec) selenium transferase [Helicobacter turcicus]
MQQESQKDIQDHLRDSLQDSLQHIPKTDKLLNALNAELKMVNPSLLKRITLEFLDAYRQELLEGGVLLDFSTCVKRIVATYQNATQKSLKPLINATGIVVHTNLGRSIFSEEILEEIKPILTQYNNLEYNLQKGSRGERYIHLQGQFKALLGAEDVLVVNNNAAAVFLILNTFAKGKEVIVSRGELIEIGGSFRIPRVMEDSGAILHEVGTTNKTHFKDYQEAISENSAMLFKAHKSNYAIEGFSEEVGFNELVKLARKYNLIDYYDLGSGYFSVLDSVFTGYEPSLETISALNPSLVSFSGDKLIGGAQAGIIFGKKALIDKLKQNQLLRMLRVDKFTIAALEATLSAYLKGNIKVIPTAQMLLRDKESLHALAQELAAQIPPNFNPQIIATKSYSGGGAMPSHYLESFGVAIFAKDLSVLKLDETKLEQHFRRYGIIARLENSALILDMRTLFKSDFTRIVESLKALL